MDIRLTDEAERIAEVRPRERLNVILDQPGGTGYVWELEGDTTRIRVLNEPYKPTIPRTPSAGTPHAST